ncbi:MAG: hypothetical protein CMJ49_12920 [Planctomycetaceae bacterium]|nr:hypothetical protein [Planctomycetaceae bacterium]
MTTHPQAIAHWPLAGDTRDAVANHHGQPHAVTYTNGPTNQPKTAANFDGKESRIQIPDHPDLRLGNQNFTFTAWIRAEFPMTHVFGDILSKFNPHTRCGINLHLAGSSPAYNSMSDQRHVHFGIDDGHISPFTDLGKPEPANANVTTLATFRGDLYAGIADADTPSRAARVFRHAGDQNWIDCGRLGDDPNVLSVMSMLVHQDKLYAGNGNWDWAKAQGHFPGFAPGPVHVFEYQGGAEWRDLGQVGHGHRLMSLASFGGDLYAGMDAGHGGGKVFRYAGNQSWTDCGAPDGKNIESLLPHRGSLYAATHGSAYRYQGNTTWTCIGKDPFNINQIHAMAEIDGKLWIGTWPQGYVLRHERSSNKWINTGRLGIPEGLTECNEVMDLRVYNGKLYAALIPKAEIWRYESDGHWTLITSLASRPDYHHENIDSWCRVTALNPHAGRLCAATGTCFSRAEHQDPDHTLGRVHAFSAGQVCSHEHDIADQWTHLAAVRDADQTRLYVNGTLAARSNAPARTTFDLTNTHPLHIGYGPQTYFTGAIADVRLYDRALTDQTIADHSSSAID